MSDWINVKDRLPEKTGWFLCYGDGAMACYAFQNGKWMDWAMSQSPGLDIQEITHWRELPQPPTNAALARDGTTGEPK